MQNQAIQVKLVVTLCQNEDIVVSQLLGAHIALGGSRLPHKLVIVRHSIRSLHILNREHIRLTHEELLA
jgi:hypothetical protein